MTHATGVSGVCICEREVTKVSRVKGKAMVAQSGGPTAVINASVAGVIQTALANESVFTGVYGAYNRGARRAA